MFQLKKGFILMTINLFILTNNNGVYGLGIPIISDIQDAIALAGDIENVLKGNVPFKSLIVKTEDPVSIALRKLEDISTQVSTMAKDVSSKMDNVLNTMLEQIPLQQEISATMRDFHKQITRIDGLFDDFMFFVEDAEKYNKRTLNDFLDTLTSTKNFDLPDVLNQMHSLFVLSRSASLRESLMQLLTKARQAAPNEKICNLAYSFQERLYEIFNIIAVSEMRGYIMTMFAYEILAVNEDTSYDREIKKATAKYVMRTEEYILTTQKVIAAAQREVYRCDPSEYIQGKTYIEMEGLFSGYIIAEQEAFSEDTCYYTCGDIDTKQRYRCITDEYGQYCPKTECLGRMWSCSWIGDTTACETSKNYRRYEWAQTANGLYGKKDSNAKCTEQYYPKLTLFNKCDVCICRCVELQAKSKAIRALSLRPSLSNINENKVVSNVKFTLKDKLVHIEIEEAELLPQAQININETQWVPLESFKYLEEGDIGKFTLSEGSELKYGSDYTFITDQQRLFNIDNVIASREYVMTGIRMAHEKDGDVKSAVGIQVHATKFDYRTGKLDPSSTQWYTPTNQPEPNKEYLKDRTEVDYGKKTESRKSPSNAPFSRVNQKILFGPSNIWDDVGQSTIPMFDAQPVGINRTMAHGGVSTFVRGAADYGGFIAMKLFNIDISPHMNAVMRKKDLKNYKKLYREKLSLNPPTQ